MEKIILLLLVVVSIASSNAQQADSLSERRLLPVDSLLSKIKPDTSRIEVPDSLKVDTVYIDNPLNVLKVGVDLPSAYGFASITYERVLWFMGSAQLKVDFMGKYNPFSKASFIKEAYANTNRISGIGLTPEFRYYGTEKYAPLGLFVGVYVPLRFATLEAPATIVHAGQSYSLEKTDLSYSLVGGGFDAGYQHIIKKKITIEVLIGLAVGKGTFSERFYTKKFIDPNGIEFENKYALRDGTIGNAFYPRFEINLGWAF